MRPRCRRGSRKKLLLAQAHPVERSGPLLVYERYLLHAGREEIGPRGAHPLFGSGTLVEPIGRADLSSFEIEVCPQEHPRTPSSALSQDVSDLLKKLADGKRPAKLSVHGKERQLPGLARGCHEHDDLEALERFIRPDLAERLPSIRPRELRIEKEQVVPSFPQHGEPILAGGCLVHVVPLESEP